jgi:hypothetical protein
MLEDQIYEALLTEIKKKFSKNPLLVNRLVEILFIEKEAVYRRLRREVPFTFSEIATITKNLGISLDNIVGIECEKSRPFQLKLPEFVSPKECDYQMLNSFFDFLRSTREIENTEMGVVTNLIPQDLFSGFDCLTRFNIFRWNYHYHDSLSKTFRELVIPDKIVQGFRTQFEESKNMKSTHYVFDSHIFQYFSNSIKYFQSIKLIEKEDIMKIKEELLQLLNYIEAFSTTGKFKETGNSVYLYIAEARVHVNYCYIDAGDVQFSMIKTFLLTSATSMDRHTFEKMKNWVLSFIKISNLITIAAEQQRILYFENQRKIINEL